MRSSRLLEMLLLLQARGQVTAAELAERLEVSARALFVLSTGGAQDDLGLGNAARSAVLKVMRAVPAPFRPAATAASQLILVDPERWMRMRYRSGGVRGSGEAGEAPARRRNGVELADLWQELRRQVEEVLSPPEMRDDLAAVAADTVSLYDRTLHDRTRV